MTSGDEHSPNTMTTWTLGAIKKRNLVLEGYCQSDGCGNFFVFNVDRLIASAGADYLVVGRPILAAEDPRAAAQSIVDEIAAAK